MNPWPYGIKDLNGETIIGNFYEKELLLVQDKIVILEMKSKKYYIKLKKLCY